MKTKVIALMLIASIISAGCASSVAVPVPVAQVGDETKSCDAIVNEMQSMVSTQIQADGNRDKQIGTNAALGLVGIFTLGIPWFFMDLGGAAEAEQKAAKARYERLQQMQMDKRCQASPVVTQEINAGLPVFRTTEPITTSPSRTAITPGAKTAGELPNPAKRLEDLDTIFKKGLITQDEYNAKKTEIMKSL